MRSERWFVVLLLIASGCGGETARVGQAEPNETERSEAATQRAMFFQTLRQAGAARRRGEREEAVRLWRQALETEPEHEACLVDLVRTLRELDRDSEALA